MVYAGIAVIIILLIEAVIIIPDKLPFLRKRGSKKQ